MMHQNSKFIYQTNLLKQFEGNNSKRTILNSSIWSVSGVCLSERLVDIWPASCQHLQINNQR